ncbi:MAG: hypothetical protein AAF403_00710 [Pseudomonadota bacterium]
MDKHRLRNEALELAYFEGIKDPSDEDLAWALLKECARTLKKLPDQEQIWMRRWRGNSCPHSSGRAFFATNGEVTRMETLLDHLSILRESGDIKADYIKGVFLWAGGIKIGQLAKRLNIHRNTLALWKQKILTQLAKTIF